MSDDRTQDMMQRARKGETFKSIAADYGITDQEVRRIITGDIIATRMQDYKTAKTRLIDACETAANELQDLNRALAKYGEPVNHGVEAALRAAIAMARGET